MKPSAKIGTRSSVIAIIAAFVCGGSLMAQNAPATPPAPPAVAPVPEVSVTVPRHRGIIGEGYPEKMTYTATCPKFVFDISSSAVQESTNRAFVEGEIARLPALKDKWDDYELCLKTNFDLDRDIIKNSINTALSGYINNDKVYGDDVYDAVDAAWQVILKNEKAQKKITEDAYVSNWKAPEGVFKGYFTGTKPEDVKYIASCPAYTPEVTAQLIGTVQTRARLMQIIDVIKAETTRRQSHADCRQKQAVEDFMALQKAMIASFTDNTWTPEYEAYRKKLEVFNNVVEGLKMPGGILAPKAAPAKPPAKPNKAKQKN